MHFYLNQEHSRARPEPTLIHLHKIGIHPKRSFPMTKVLFVLRQCHHTKVEFLNTLSETRWNWCPDISALLFEDWFLLFGGMLGGFPSCWSTPFWIPHPGNAVGISGGWKALSFLRQRKCAEQAIVGWHSPRQTPILWTVPTKTGCIGLYFVRPYYNCTCTGSTIVFFSFQFQSQSFFLETGSCEFLKLKLMQGKLSRAAA